MDIFRDPFWQGLAAILAIVGMLLGILFYFLPQSRQTLRQWLINAFKTIGASSKRVVACASRWCQRLIINLNSLTRWLGDLHWVVLLLMGMVLGAALFWAVRWLPPSLPPTPTSTSPAIPTAAPSRSTTTPSPTLLTQMPSITATLSATPTTELPPQPTAVAQESVTSTPLSPEQEALEGILEISKILEKNYAEQILEEIATWEAQGLDSKDILEMTIVEIEVRISKLKTLADEMESPEFKESDFGQAASSMIGTAAILAQGEFEELLDEVQTGKDRNHTDAEILGKLKEELMALKLYEIKTT